MGAGRHLYDEIGRSYTKTRREDPRVAAAIHSCLGTATTIVNVGAGAGSYEPADRVIVAVDPSVHMLRQRQGRTINVVRGIAEALPFPDDAFDAAMAVLTVHHWSDPRAGLQEMRRVSQRQIVFFFEALHTHHFWGLDYFPEALALPSETNPPDEQLLREHLDVHAVHEVLVTHDCLDGFGAAFWARPEAYLDRDVQDGMSWLALLPADVRERGTRQLEADLASGEWDRRHGHLREQATFDAGYRIAIAE